MIIQTKEDFRKLRELYTLVQDVTNLKGRFEGYRDDSKVRKYFTMEAVVPKLEAQLKKVFGELVIRWGATYEHYSIKVHIKSVNNQIIQNHTWTPISPTYKEVPINTESFLNYINELGEYISLNIQFENSLTDELTLQPEIDVLSLDSLKNLGNSYKSLKGRIENLEEVFHRETEKYDPFMHSGIEGMIKERIGDVEITWNSGFRVQKTLLTKDTPSFEINTINGCWATYEGWETTEYNKITTTNYKTDARTIPVTVSEMQQICSEITLLIGRTVALKFKLK
ncbi:hypothetical protein [Bacillus cereus]|uniref:Uncharacterized protein n=1 Tax=Bacillus cereus TaxID=1396 RepID=A0A164LCZ6_BACCE|nr:hypothetical protein [Bacillus cereus]KZD55682.1 hypothetical protein B4088_5427 [Bacillus cereus]